MRNKDNNLKDFLRRKFSDIEDLEEAWTKPSLMVRNSVLDQITEPTPNKRKKAFLLFLLLLGVLAGVGLFEYIKGRNVVDEATLDTKNIRTDAEILAIESGEKQLNSLAKKSAKSNARKINAVTGFSKDELRQKNASLIKVVQRQNDIITQLKKENLGTKENTIEKKLRKETFLEGHSKEAFKNLLEVNKHLKIEQDKLNFLNETQGEEIERLNDEKQLLLDSLNGQIYAFSSKPEEKEITRTKNKIAFQPVKPLIANELKENELIANEFVTDSVNLEVDFGLEKPKKKVGFEVGYQLGIRGGMAEVIEYVGQQGVITNQVKDKFLVSHVHGLNVGISPVKNFWIKTGAHVGNMNLHQTHHVKFIYNSNSSASTVTSGAYAEDINNLSFIGISTINKNIGTLANAQGTVNGDELELDFQTNLVLTSLQIPLEFNYMYGKKRLQALFQLGGQWNLLNYQYYMYGFETKITNQSNLSLSDASAGKPDASSVQYWGLHAGVGLNYNISKHLTFQGVFSYEYYFPIKNLNRDLSYDSGVHASTPIIADKVANSISSMRFGLKLGLNYRF
jgi:hypothetical protein